MSFFRLRNMPFFPSFPRRRESRPRPYLIGALVCLLAACAPASTNPAPAAAPRAAAQPGRILVVAVKNEPKIIAAVGPGLNASVSLGLSKRMFNADFALLDQQGRPLPYIAEALPQ